MNIMEKHIQLEENQRSISILVNDRLNHLLTQLTSDPITSIWLSIGQARDIIRRWPHHSPDRSPPIMHGGAPRSLRQPKSLWHVRG
jgi:hypothetical protein